MELDEAIEYLQTEADLAKRQPETGVYDALNMGIGALKRIKDRRDLKTGWEKQLLPSETKD